MDAGRRRVFKIGSVAHLSGRDVSLDVKCARTDIAKARFTGILISHNIYYAKKGCAQTDAPGAYVYSSEALLRHGFHARKPGHDLLAQGCAMICKIMIGQPDDGFERATVRAADRVGQGAHLRPVATRGNIVTAEQQYRPATSAGRSTWSQSLA